MSGNSYGRNFCVTTYGESHGVAIGCIVDGCPPNFALDEQLIQKELNRRRPGSSKYVTQRREPDQVKILSGLFEGLTTGTPIAMMIENQDAKSKDYSQLRQTYRPGHADWTYSQKYNIRDHQGGGRSSARETAARVAAGAIAKQLLSQIFNAEVKGRLQQMDDIPIPLVSWEEVERNSFFASDQTVITTLEKRIDELRREGDSCGAIIEVLANGIPPGLGEPTFDRLDADIAKALMSIPAVKGVEIGDGFASAQSRGSQNNDNLSQAGFLSNHAGGILGGISNGQTIVARMAIKPTSSIRLPQQTINEKGENVTITTTGRHDPCVGLRAVPIAEAMVALTLVDHWLRFSAQCKSSIK